jgi:hypothetical protein
MTPQSDTPKSFDPSIKPCQYRNCPNSVPTLRADGTVGFDYCEVCRAIVNRNSIALIQDPHSPIPQRAESQMQAVIHNLTPDELLNWTHKVEWTYLTLQTAIKSRELDIHRATRFAEGVELVRAERSKPTTIKRSTAEPKEAKARAPKKSELQTLIDLGYPAEQAQKMLAAKDSKIKKLEAKDQELKNEDWSDF